LIYILFINEILFKSLFNFYLVYVLQITDADLTKEVPKELALIPLILYGSSALGSLFLNRFYIKIGRQFQSMHTLYKFCFVGKEHIL